MLIAREIGRHRHHCRRNGACPLQHPPQNDNVDVMTGRGDETADCENREPGVDDRPATVAVRPPAERYLQDGLRQSIGADRDADQRQIVSTGQTFGVDRKHREDREHPQHAQSENGGQADACPQFRGAHLLAVGH
ncbi:hypothetical protein D3C83_13920 [compost metagenome]